MASIVVLGSCVLAHAAYKSYKSHEIKKMDIIAAKMNDGYGSDSSLGLRDGEIAGEHPPGYEEVLRTKHGRKRQSLRAMWPLRKHNVSAES